MKTFEKAKDPAFWQAVRTQEEYASIRNALLEQWDTHCQGPVPTLPYHLIRRYFEMGDRRSYETLYHQRRRALVTSALLSLIWPEEEKYLERLQDLIFAVCNEYFWPSPAHMSEADRIDPRHIDLFTGETALILSDVYALLKDRLDPLIVKRLVQEVESRVLYPYIDRTFPFEGYRSNWTAVCTACVASAFIHIRPDLAPNQIERFEQGAQGFLSGYGDDGYCQEGFMYWAYGFGFFVAYADLIRDYTDGRIDHFRDPKVERIATFFQKKQINGDSPVCFADAMPSTATDFGLPNYLKREYPDTVQVFPGYANPLTDSRSSFWLRGLLWSDITLQPDDTSAPATHYGADAQWLLVRKEGFGFAAKAGHNDEPHNHNDVGSFVFAKNGHTIFTDPGRGQYTREYFRAESRYSHFHPSSFAHSVPIIDGRPQQFGRAFASRDVIWDGSSFHFDMAECYGDPALTGLQRRFDIGESAVILTDTFAYSGEGTLTERLVALEMPTAEDGRLVFSNGVLCYDPSCCTLTVSTETPSPDKNLDGQSSPETTYYLLDFTLNPGVTVFTVTLQ